MQFGSASAAHIVCEALCMRICTARQNQTLELYLLHLRKFGRNSHAEAAMNSIYSIDAINNRVVSVVRPEGVQLVPADIVLFIS